MAGLSRVSVDGVDYVAAVETVPGRGAAEVLAAVFGQAVAGLRADANMRWSDPDLSYVRPVRWLLALLGDAAVPVAVSSLASGAHHPGAPHRRASRSSRSARPTAYAGLLAAHGVIIDPRRRREQVIAGAGALAASVGGRVDPEGEAALIDEVTNLVEQPEPVLGRFDERYLDLPGEILTTVMRKHQRYLPVRDAAGRLHGVLRGGGERRRAITTWCGPGTRRCCGPGTRTPRSSGGPTCRPARTGSGRAWARSRSSSGSARWPTAPTASPAWRGPSRCPPGRRRRWPCSRRKTGGRSSARPGW